MIDLKNAYEIRNVLNNKVIDKIEDDLGNIIYENFRELITSGVPPIILQKCKNANLVDYKIYGDSVQQLLPNEYQQVEYVESTGTQIINSGVVTYDDVGMYADFYIDEASMIMGSRGNDDSINRFWINPSTTLYYGWNTSNALEINCLNNRSVVELNLYNSRKVVASNNTVETPITAILNETLSSDNTANIGLFGNMLNSGSYRGRISKIYRAKITKGDVLVRDFIPCYRKSDNVIGMYDLITRVFYENKGTGTFLKGTNTPTPDTPTLDTPIEIESVGDRTKNLFNQSYGQTTTNGVTVKYLKDEDCYVLNGTATTTGRMAERFINVPIVKGNKVSLSAIYISGKFIQSESATNLPIGYFGASDTPNSRVNFATVNFQENNTVKENVTCNYNYVSAFWFYLYKGQTFEDYKVKFQLEVGSKATEFEPFGYRIPVKVSGKNLLNYKNARLRDNYTAGTIDISDDGTITYNGNYWYSIDINLSGGKTYIFNSEYENSSGNNPFWYFIYSDGTRYGTGFGKNINVPADKEIIRIDIYTVVGTDGANTDNLKMWNIQLEEGKTATEYEAYVEPITTNIYLKEPLRKVGEDTDYIDFEKKRVIRKIYEQQILSTLTWVGYNISAVHNEAFKYKGIDTTLLTSNCGKSAQRQYKFSNANLNRIEIYYDWFGVEDVEGVKTKLAEMETNRKPFTVYYPSNEIPEEEIELPNIPTFKGTTIIEVDTNILPSNMEVKYIGKE